MGMAAVPMQRAHLSQTRSRLHKRLTALLALSAVLALAVPSVAQDGANKNYCEASDYERQSSVCTDGKRSIQYAKARDCNDPFPTIAGQPHQETCDCSPEDYAVVYSFETAGEGSSPRCILRYVPKNASLPAASGQASCTAHVKQEAIQVDEAYCELSQVPCKEENLLVTYSDCMYDTEQELEETHPLFGKAFFEVINYFDSFCNPMAKGSIHLPHNKLMPCDTKCGAGSILVKAQCQKCPAGTFSPGGAIRLDKFYTEPTRAQGFEYFCQYTNATGTFGCDNWHVEAGTLAVGPFNEPNNWYPDECASDEAYDCYNNLRAQVKMTVKLKRAGYVKFQYRVSAEEGYDGLSFYIDVEETPTMLLQSLQFDPKEVQFPLTEGFHTLTWVYSKDEKWTAGSDTASISDLEVDGVELNEVACQACPAGFYSGEGAGECTPCAINFFSGPNATQCQPCPDDQYSLTAPRTQCLPRPPCDMSKDAASTYSACSKSTKKRSKSYHWLRPHTCSGTLPAAEEEDCPPCPAGQVAREFGDTIHCVFCPPGSCRPPLDPGEADNETCIKCETGYVAIKELNLEHMHLQSGEQLPQPFITGCSQGDCSETGSWRLTGGTLTSVKFDGTDVAAWLKMNVTLTMVGDVSFNFSVDIPSGDMSRGFFFYIDGTPVDEMVDNGVGSLPVTMEPMLSGPWQMEKGSHTLMWKWVKANSTIAATRDTAILYDIKVRGVTDGGATSCERVPDGAQAVEDGTSWEECPPGYYSEGGESKCAKCPANTFNPYPFGGKWACIQCGAGTTSQEGSTACEIGDISMPTSFCQYFLPTQANSSQFVVYDLAPLSRVHPGSMYGPVYHDPSSDERDNGALYYLAVCDNHITNYTCLDHSKKPLNTSMCRVNPKNKILGKFRPAYSLGDRMELKPLSMDARVERRGFKMLLTGERCFQNQLETNTTVSFICDPTAGYGMPHAWTVAGMQAAYDPAKEFPNWIDRSKSMVIPVGSQETCTYELVWYSAYACPLCTKDDYEAVEVSGCINDTHITYKYKQPKICQPNPQEPLPPNVLCRACTTEDYQEYRDACADEKGVHNVTYSWIHPKLCTDSIPGAATLPNNTVAGPCVPTVYLESANLLKPQWLALLILSLLAIVALAVTSFITWLKSRRIYAMYSKLVAKEDVAGGDFGDHEEEMEEVEGTAATEDTRLYDDGGEEEDNTLHVTADPTEYRRDDDDDKD